MRLIGLKILEMDESIQKVLKSGWYPFGNYEEPNDEGFLLPKKKTYVERSLYRLRLKQPEISLSCIVGMNGSGKSTIIDIIYRVINNLAVRIGEVMETPLKTEMEYAYGVNADLYYECDDYMNVIKCRDDSLKCYQYKYNAKKFPLFEKKLNGKTALNLLSRLFYTIGVNYSLYAFNKEDYKSELDNRINGDWLHGVFHKNDGYLSPLTLVPYREDGNISIKNENDLAQQRITALAILSRAKKKQFPEGYYPRMLNYNLNEKFDEEKLGRFIEKYQHVCMGMDIGELVKVLKREWELLIKAKEPNIDLKKWEGSVEWNLALFYMAYKSAKISLTYNDYYQEFTKENVADKTKEIVHRLWEKEDHITLKIHQCLNYLRKDDWRNSKQKAVDDLIAAAQPKTYDDVIKVLPPPFYNIDVTFIKKSRIRREWVESGWFPSDAWFDSEPWGGNNHLEEVSAWSDDKGTTFKLSSMSSGEKQILVAISYVLYHIKNIQSVDLANYRVPYHHINIIFDEVELYFHPDYQRRFIAMLIESLSWTSIDRRKIRSIHILIATHSPFVLTDALTERTLYLKEGVRQNVIAQTFGANYYDLLDNSFFFEKTAIGEISTKALRRWVKKTKISGTLPPEEVLDMIGDTYVKRYLKATVKDKDYV